MGRVAADSRCAVNRACRAIRGLVATLLIAACGTPADEPGDARQPDARVAQRSAATVAVGGSHVCALLEDTTVACSGDNSVGQLGSGSTTAVATAVRVSGLADAVSLAGSQGDHTCALRGDQTVACWGDDGDGQIGVDMVGGDPIVIATSPVGLGPVIEIAAGPRNTCALLADGTVQCWGEDASGQVGDGSPPQPGGFRPSVGAPRPVVGLPQVATAIALGGSQDYYHSCAVLGDGSPRCWGNNVFGQIGAAAPHDLANTQPVSVPGIATVDTIVPGGSNRTCAIVDGGRVTCWGHDTNGNQPQDVPQPVIGITTARQVVISMLQVCVRLADETVACWTGSGVVDVAPVPVPGLTDIVELAAGGARICARRRDGAILCWAFDTAPEPIDLSPP